MNGDWSDWHRFNLAGDTVDALTVTQHASGYPMVVCVGPDGRPFAFLAGDDTPHPVPVGALWDTEPLIAVHARTPEGGALHVFGVDRRHRLWAAIEEPGAPFPQTWQQVPVSAADLVSVTSVNGAGPSAARTTALVRTSAGQLWAVWQEAPGGPWSDIPLHAAEDGLAGLDAAAHEDGRLEVVGVGADGTVWHLGQQQPLGAWPPGWSPLPDLRRRLESVRLVAGPDGRLEAFGVAADGQVWRTWQDAAQAPWRDWRRYADEYAPELRALAVTAAGGAGLPLLLGLDGGGRLWQTWQSPAGRWRSGWRELPRAPGPFAAIDACQGEDDRPQAFAVDLEGNLWRCRNRG